MATRAEVLNAYATTPGANIKPGEEAINYWMNAGLGGFSSAVAQYNKTNDAALVASAVNRISKDPEVALGHAGDALGVDATAAAARLVEAMAAGTIPWDQNAVDVWSAASGGQKLAGPDGSPVYNLPGTRGVDLESMYLFQNPDGTTASKAYTAQTPGQAAASAAGNVLGVLGGALAPGLGQLIGGGLLGTVGAGALIGGTTAGLQGGNILKGAITGGAGAYAVSQLDQLISGTAGLDGKGTDVYNATQTAQRIADSGGSLTDIASALTKYNLPPDSFNSIVSDAISGSTFNAAATGDLTNAATANTVNVTGGLGSNLASTVGGTAGGLLTGNAGNNAVTVTGTKTAADLQAEALQTIANNVATIGANNAVTITGTKTPEQIEAERVAALASAATTANTGLGANQTVNVTGKTPAQAQAEALAASIAASTASTGGLPANQTVNVTDTKPNNTLTGLPIPTSTSPFTGPKVEITSAKPTTNTVDKFVDPTTGLLTIAGLTALGLSTSGPTSLNNTGNDTANGGSLVDLITKYGPTVAGLFTGGLSTANAYNAADAAQTIYNTEAGTLGTAAKAAAPGYQFSPIGMTTAFGNATPKFDANGKLIGYDYAATPGVAAQRDQLMKLSQQALPSTTDPTAIMNNYIQQQQGLLAPGQAQDLATLQAQLAATGRSGLGTGATAGTAFSPALAATNPQLAAYYNSLAQQNQQITANAPTYAQNLLNAQIGTSGTLFGQAQGLETAAQQPLNMGSALGEKITAGTSAASNASYKAAQDAAALIAQGAGNALYAKTEANKALINQLSGSSTSGGTSGLFGDLLKLIPSFLSGGTTVVGGAGTGATNTTGTSTTGTTNLPTKLLSGGTTVVNGATLPAPNLTVNNASNTLTGGGGLITGSNATASPATAANTFVNNGGSGNFGPNGSLVSAVPQYDATGKVIGYTYGNTAAAAPATNTGLLSANTAVTTPTGAPSVADIYTAYMNNPKAMAANPFGPDPQAIQYWQQRGLADFNQVVASM
jgi:hypothetical protein